MILYFTHLNTYIPSLKLGFPALFEDMAAIIIISRRKCQCTHSHPYLLKYSFKIISSEIILSTENII